MATYNVLPSTSNVHLLKTIILWFIKCCNANILFFSFCVIFSKLISGQYSVVTVFVGSQCMHLYRTGTYGYGLSMDMQAKSMDMDMDMDGSFNIHAPWVIVIN